MTARWRARLTRVGVRGRVLALVLVLLLLSCTAVLVATTLELRHFLIARLDQQLSVAGQTYAISLEHPDNDSDDIIGIDATGQAPGTIGARILDGRVTSSGIVHAPAQDAPLSAEDNDRLAELTRPTAAITVRLPDLGTYRVSVSPGRDGDLLVTGLSQDPVDDTVHQLMIVEGVVFASALLLTGLVGAWLVGLSLRPLTAVARTARRVSELPLSEGDVSLHERVPNPAPDTEVGQVASALNHMLEHIDAALSARHHSEARLRQFAADASHELRTPVAVIRSHAEFVQRGDSELPAEAERALSRISAEAARMGVLVDNLLLLARLDAGRPLAVEDVDLTLLLLDTVADARASAPDHNWRLDLPDEPVVVSGDQHALHEVVTNLLGNASRHTPPGTTVTASMSLDGRSDRALISVVDDGPGIPADVLPIVFERFTRADDARSRASGSTGLGLAIVHAIVHAHGGSLSVQSSPGHTEFVVSLPVGSAPGGAGGLEP